MQRLASDRNSGCRRALRLQLQLQRSGNNAEDKLRGALYMHASKDLE